MIILGIVCTLTFFPQTPDSLQAELNKEIRMPVIMALNQWYVAQEDYSRAVAHCSLYVNKVTWNDQALLYVLIGDDLLYSGSLLAAREAYLVAVSRYTKSGAANDALERLYMLETARDDTSALKRLGYALSRMYVEQWNIAEDSLKQLLPTRISAHAYYYLALMYKQTGDIPLALGALDALEKTTPHDLRAPLLHAELYILSNRYDEARTALEDFLIHYPRSIYAVSARALLNSLESSNP